MQRGHDSELRSAWFDLSPRLQAELKIVVPSAREKRIPVMLGLSGTPDSRLALGAIATVFRIALSTQRIPEIPAHDLLDEYGQPTDIVTLKVGMLYLGKFFPKQAGLGEGREGIAFIQHQSASDDEFSTTLDSIIKYSNGLLNKHSNGRIPTLSEFRYPLEDLDF